jgi:hypothetical protein
MHDAPHCTIARPDAARFQLLHEPAQRQVGFGLQAPDDPIALAGQHQARTPAPRLGSRNPRLAEPLRPLHDTRHADLERRCHRAAGAARHHRRHDTVTQV